MRSAVKKAVSAIRTFLINGFSRNPAENFLPKDNSKDDKGFAPFLRVYYLSFIVFSVSFVNQGPPTT